MKRVYLKINRNDQAFVLVCWTKANFPCSRIIYHRAKDLNFVGVEVMIEDFETYMFLLELSKKIQFTCFDAETKKEWKIPLTYEDCEKELKQS